VAGPEEIWLPLVDERIGRVVQKIQEDDPEIERLVGSPRRMLAFRTFAYIRVGVLLGRLLVESDIVTLHVPLTDNTRHLIDARRLALMNRDAVLVNTSRGPVVDEEALAVALEEGAIFAAGLDVYEREPKVHPRLLVAPRTVLLPHIGSASLATRTRMAQVAAECVRAVLAGEEPKYVVQPTREEPS